MKTAKKPMLVPFHLLRKGEEFMLNNKVHVKYGPKKGMALSGALVELPDSYLVQKVKKAA
jgi:hypothetical protein